MIFGWVYLLKKPWSNECKIGISKDAAERELHLEKKNGKLDCRRKVLVFFPKRLEKQLHRRFDKWRLEPDKKKRGDGHTEWFDLVFSQRMECAAEMMTVFLIQYSILTLIILAVVYWFYKDVEQLIIANI